MYNQQLMYISSTTIPIWEYITSVMEKEEHPLLMDDDIV